MTTNQLEKYFERIEYSGNHLKADLDLLTELQLLHSQTFPFENLNSFLNLPVKLDSDSLFQKFVINQRGGYCYEQNILFMNVLRTLNFNVRGLTGRVFNNEKMIERRTHMLLLIDINGMSYISDVGFGSLASCMPLRLEIDVEQKTNHELYRLKSSDEGFILQIKLKDAWRSLYLFDLQTQYHEDFEVGNWYTSTHPSSNFRHKLMASLKNEDRSFSLDNHVFTTYYLDGRKEKAILKSSSEIEKTLEDVFGINMNNLELPSDF